MYYVSHVPIIANIFSQPYQYHCYQIVSTHPTGLSPEDRVTLKKTYKLLVETVQAEDVIDRLQQSQVIKFSDRQEVLAIAKKQERMQVTEDFVVCVLQYEYN